jgi:hypothetical protein
LDSLSLASSVLRASPEGQSPALPSFQVPEVSLPASQLPAGPMKCSQYEYKIFMLCQDGRTMRLGHFHTTGMCFSCSFTKLEDGLHLLMLFRTVLVILQLLIWARVLTAIFGSDERENLARTQFCSRHVDGVIFASLKFEQGRHCVEALGGGGG